jgi:hypothetical protein
MITDLNVQHELLKTALAATDNYLAAEKAAQDVGKAHPTHLRDFTTAFDIAKKALMTLGVLHKHEEYMQSHVDTMLELSADHDNTLADNPTTVPSGASGEMGESVQVDELSNDLLARYKTAAGAQASAADKAGDYKKGNKRFSGIIKATKKQFNNDLKEEGETLLPDEEKLIEDIVSNFEWDDLVEFYDEDELVYEDEDGNLQERLSAQSRLKKRQSFSRFRGKRNSAKGIKIKRASSMEVLKKRAIGAARRSLYKRILRNRDKSSLSASEKDRVEQQVGRLKFMQTALATRLLPKMRSIEQKRLAGSHAPKSTAPKLKPSKAPSTKSTAPKLKPSKAPSTR